MRAANMVNVAITASTVLTLCSQAHADFIVPQYAGGVVATYTTSQPNPPLTGGTMVLAYNGYGVADPDQEYELPYSIVSASGYTPSPGTYSSVRFETAAATGGQTRPDWNYDFATLGESEASFFADSSFGFLIEVENVTIWDTVVIGHPLAAGTIATEARVSTFIGTDLLVRSTSADLATPSFEFFPSFRIAGTAPPGTHTLYTSAAMAWNSSLVVPFQDYIEESTRVEIGTRLKLEATSLSATTPWQVTAEGGPYARVASADFTTVRLTDDGACGVRTESIEVGTTGKLDIGDDSLVIDYSGTTPLAQVAALVSSGYNGGAWNGYGIISSAAAANPSFGVGYGEAGTLGITNWGTCAVDSSTVIVDYCLYGDANLSGTVDFNDLLLLAQNYNGTGKFWYQGDFNYDGVVDFTDLLKLAQNDGLSGLRSADLSLLASPEFVSDLTLAQSFVPEPSVCSAVALLGMLRRRR
jgi:hypothetical protein